MRTLIVSMPETLGMSPLQSAMREVTAITKLRRLETSCISGDVCNTAQDSGLNTTVLQSPATDEVADLIPVSSVVHFICHGISDPQNPSGSYLVLGEEFKSDPS